MKNGGGWHLLGQMLWGQRIRMAGVLFFTVLAAAAELLPYWLIFQAIEILLSAPDQITQQFYALLNWLILALLAKYILYAVAYFLSHQAAFSILTDTRHKLVAKLAHAPLEWLQQRTSGKLKHTMLQDVDNIENFIAHHTVEVLSAAVGPVLVAFFLFWVNWQLALAALLIAPMAVLSSTLFMRGLTEEYLEYNESSAKLDSTMIEYLRNMPIMKLFRQDSTSFQVMRQRLQNYYGIVAKFTQKTVPGWSLFSSLVGASVLVILPTGIFLYEQGTVTVAQVIMAVILGSGMLKPLLKISRFFMEINEVLASVRQIEPILALSTDKRVSECELASNVSIEFRQLYFRYQDKEILKNINLTLLPGSFTVLLGPSGAGKTTLAQLLAGLFLPSSGSVEISGKAVTTLNDEQRSQLIAVATQDVFLFKGTIKDNLLLARPQATNEEIDRALKVAQADDLILSLPGGLNTHLQEQGIRLSGGEKQRLAIARAFLANTPVIVLDEASSSLDNLTQQAFYRDIKTHYPDKTILVIAHRSYGVETADQIVVLEDGVITDIGQHQDLLANNNFYQQLCQCQTKNAQWALVTSVDTEILVHAQELNNV
jgi:sulfate-transporting ATPase/ATP-binding cassette subfamily B protein